MPPLRPDTLSEALDMLARPILVQATAGGPPPRVHPGAQLMDVRRVAEMSGMHRLGGEIIIGVNSDWAALMRSSLLRPAAACLIDAATLMAVEQPGGALLHALDDRSDNPIVLALTALGARVEAAVRKSVGRISRRTLSLQEWAQSPPLLPHLPLNVRFSAPFSSAGSAFYREQELSPLQPDVQAAAAFVSLDAVSGAISSARLALSVPRDRPILCHAAEALLGKPPSSEAIEAVVRLAQRICPQPRASTPLFSLALSSHLIRKTLDQAIARSQAT